MYSNKGFSLIEFLVVVALIGILSIFMYTPKSSKWNTEVSTAQSKIVSQLKYYQKKSMRDGYKYYVRMNQDAINHSFKMEAFVDKSITSRQSYCEEEEDSDFLERRLFDSLKNIRVVGCKTGGSGCKNTSVADMGICFFPNGSSVSTKNRNEWYIFHSAGDDVTHATNGYKFIVWKTTSFIETFICRGNATHYSISSDELACGTTEWIQE